MKAFFFFLSVFFSVSLFGQTADSSVFDTVFYKRLRKVEVIENKKSRNAEEEANYQKLRRKVLKLYPYALMAKQIYKDINKNLDSLQTKKAKRKYRNAKEQELRERFEEEIKNLYTTDGPVLVKLIYRETGHTTFDLIKELKSGFKAWSFNVFFAKSHGYNLRDTYDPNVDTEIEGIIQSMQKEGTLPTGL